MQAVSITSLCDQSLDYTGMLPADKSNFWIEFLPKSKFKCRSRMISPVSDMKEFLPETQSKCFLRGNMEENIDPDLFKKLPIPYYYDLEHRVDPVGLAGLSKVKLLTPHGFLFDSNSRLIGESWHNAQMVKSPLREVQTILSHGLLNSEPTFRIKEPAALLMGPWSWVYYHWIFENLTRLWVLDAFPELADILLVVPAHLTRFQKDSLNALGINDNRLLFFDGSNWQFDCLYIPSFLGSADHSLRQIDWLRTKLMGAFNVQPRDRGNRRLYISRTDTATRKIINEKAIISMLQYYDFEVITPGKLPLVDQVKLFNDAEIICGSSGSGITNHIFAPRHATLVEMHPNSYVNLVHWFSSNILGQNYGFIIGQAETIRHDYKISISKLQETVDVALVLAKS